MDWHVIRDPHDPELDRLAEQLELHPLHIEDCRHRDQNAKLEENAHYLFIVLKPIEIEADQVIAVADLDIFVGRDFVVTVEEGECAPVRKILEQLQPQAARMRSDQLLHRITDALIDSYLPILDRLSELIDGLQDQVLEDPTPEALNRIFETKRTLIMMRRVLVNTRDVAGHLLRSEAKLIRRDLYPFFRDVYDHVARSLDTVEMLRDLLTGALDVYLSTVANRTNNVMKVLTVLGTIALPVLMISGIYGMNVHGLPWAESPYALAIVLVLMAAVTTVLLWWLKKRKWL